ncbi:uncharacterized protein LOC143072465 isoform X2 [Mytilus galloprovincialis]|uniref:uncharacterized protein LOC143072465 isoform X2 n=1 Tax=Mytilus galloprovincialis TaxID=29158 RepID=UPI003F7B4DEF
MATLFPNKTLLKLLMLYGTMEYKDKEVVWIKLSRFPWWPAQVVIDDNPDSTDQDKMTNVLFVKFFNEEYMEEVKNPSKIKRFECIEKDSFISKGLLITDEERKKLFTEALKMANNAVNGNTNMSVMSPSKHQPSESNSELTNTNLSTSLPVAPSENLNHDKISSDNSYIANQSCYQAFKTTKLQQRINWDKPIPDCEENQNVRVTNNENLHCSENSNGVVSKSVNVNGAKTKTNVIKGKKNFFCKKRKLTFDENVNEQSKQHKKVMQKTVLKSELPPDLSRTSTPKLSIKKNFTGTSQSKNNIIKTFTKLSQKKNNENVKPKRGRPKSKSLPKSDAITKSENAQTPKCLKWEDSFELPTPSLSQSATCTSFLATSRFDPNLDKDECDSSSDSDTDLPEGLSPITGAEYPIAEKDIVWLIWLKFPAWPAFVRRVYRKKRRIHKLSLTFIEGCTKMPNRLRVTYRCKTVVPFIDKQKQKFIDQGESSIYDPEMRRKFREACEKAESFLHQRALSSLNKEEFSFFSRESDDEEEIDSDTNMQINSGPNSSDTENRLSDTEDVLSSSPSPNYNSLEPSAKEIARIRKMTEKQSKLVEFVKSEEMKNYLLDIFYERRKSELHQKFIHGTVKEKNSLRYAGFGPIYNEEQEEEIVEILKDWLYELPKKDIPDISYVLDVWIPEAIVYALIKTKSYGRTKAKEQFYKGVYMTKSERERQHQSLMEFRGYTAEEKEEALQKSQQRMETFKYKYGLT